MINSFDKTENGYQCVIGVTKLIFHDDRRGFLAGYFF